MYKVYLLSFDDGHEYIGCTNNVRRRRDQHNENARERKSKLGIYLNDNGIVLKENDFTVLNSFEDRSVALKCEREEAIKRNKHKGTLLNDNYTDTCSRKGKNIGNTAKKYIVIDIVNQTSTPIDNLRQYCISEGLNYKSMQDTVNKTHICLNRYKVFYYEKWEQTENKNYYINGDFLKDIYTKNRSNHVSRCSKKYEVQHPDGTLKIVTNLDNFAREHNLTPGTLHSTLSKNKKTKGYKVIRRI